MKKKYQKSIFMSNFTPDAIEIEYIIKKFLPEQTPSPKLYKFAKGYQFKNQKGKQSKVYRYASEFEKGYALVFENSSYHYIDTDFNVVVCEQKIKTAEQLASLISINPKSVRKYVSPSKILSMCESTAFDLLVGIDIEEKSVSKTLSTIQHFIKKNKIEQTV